MARKRIGQMSWLDGAIEQRAGRRRDRLGEIAALIDWRPFEKQLSAIHSSVRGEASYPPLMMFKVLLVQRWYDLSDPAMEEALFVMKQSYDKLGLLDLRDDAQRVLEKNFPQSPYLKGDVRRYAPWWRVWDPEW